MSANEIRKILVLPLINLGLLAKVRAGNSIHIDEHGYWVINTESAVGSGFSSLLRKGRAMFLELRMAERRRDVFFHAAEKLIDFVMTICNSLRRWAIVLAVSDEKGLGFLRKKVEAMPRADQEEIHIIIQILRNVVSALSNANKGLNILQSAPPYNDDPSYWEKVKQQIDDPVAMFLQNVFVCLGEYQHQVFGKHITNKTDISPRSIELAVSSLPDVAAVPNNNNNNKPTTLLPDEKDTVAIPEKKTLVKKKKKSTRVVSSSSTERGCRDNNDGGNDEQRSDDEKGKEPIHNKNGSALL